MSEIHKIVLFRGAIETLSYFSRQMEVHFKERGCAVFWVDMEHAAESARRLTKFCKPKETAMLTFNFIGLGGEEAFAWEKGETIWEAMQVKCLNILVDHPLYYHRYLERKHPGMILFCLDRQHVAFVKEFYPGHEVHFLPTAGNLLLSDTGNSLLSDRTEEAKVFDAAAYRKSLIPYRKRAYDVVFIGNYAPLPDLAKHFPMQSEEYIDYYYRIIDDMIIHSDMSLHEALIKNLREEIGELSVSALKTGMVSMVFLDLYVRTYFRAKVICALAESGIKVHLFGKDWDKMICTKRDNLIWCGGQVDSAGCVRAVQNSRICLNIMPWFKDGVHDRIFTAMLNGSVALTDDSLYLRERFVDGKELRFYSLEQLECLPRIVKELLNDPETAERIASEGCETAWREHTWQKRAEVLDTYLM